ncbi:MAG: hypothetical protein IH820_06760 [Bacteroidetes bacterium]|nr:hypothetical protein [Bacteroidota bacterium]
MAPLAVFVAWLAIGASFGVVARSHRWLEPDIEKTVAEWDSLGLEKQYIAQRIFNRHYPSSGGASDSGETEEGKNGSPSQSGYEGYLFIRSVEECVNLTALQDDQLKFELITSSSKALKILAEEIDDIQLLRAFLRLACEGSQ